MTEDEGWVGKGAATAPNNTEIKNGDDHDHDHYRDGRHDQFGNSKMISDGKMILFIIIITTPIIIAIIIIINTPIIIVMTIIVIIIIITIIFLSPVVERPTGRAAECPQPQMFSMQLISVNERYDDGWLILA